MAFGSRSLTDLHIDGHIPAGYLDRVIDRVNEMKPDAVCVTGDIVNHTSLWIKPAVRFLEDSPCVVFVSFGNHDYCPNTARPGPVTFIASTLEGASAAPGASCCGIARRGLNDQGSGCGSLAWKISGAICIRHTMRSHESSEETASACRTIPTACTMSPRSARSSILSGHTHGGQMRVP